MNTVAELFPLVKAQAGSAGVCTVEELTDRMNVIGPEILDRIEAKGTVTTWCIPICNGCVVLPSDLDTPIQAWMCGEPMGFRGEFWLGRLAGNIADDLSQEVPWKEVVDDGRYAYTQVYPIPYSKNDVYEVTARSQKDNGKTVEIRYRSNIGRETIFEAKLKGDHKASSPSEADIGDVIHVIKPRTAGAVELWTRNLRTGHRLLVAVYEGNDEHPAYRLVHITGCANGKLTIKGRKKWRPLRDDTDLVPFGRVAAWRAALAAESALANRDFDNFNRMIGEAVDLLDKELSGLRPKGQAEIVDFVTPYTVWNKQSYRRRI